MVVKLDGSDRMEVQEGSHVWLKDSNLEEGELFLDWECIQDADKGTIIDLRDKIESLTEELATLLVTLGNSSKDAA